MSCVCAGVCLLAHACVHVCAYAGSYAFMCEFSNSRIRAPGSLIICVYVRAYACAHACVEPCVCVCSHVHTCFACLLKCASLLACLCACVCILVHMCTGHMCVVTSVSTCVFVRVLLSLYKCARACVHAYRLAWCVHMPAHVCVLISLQAGLCLRVCLPAFAQACDTVLIQLVLNLYAVCLDGFMFVF